MNVYVETNFVLELAFQQEESTACEDIIKLCEKGDLNIVLPAYSLAEPHEKLIRQKTQRRVLYDSIDLEFNQLKRNSNYVDHINSIKDKLLFLLIQSNEEEERRFRDYLKKLTAIADIIPLTAEILNSANEQRFDLK